MSFFRKRSLLRLTSPNQNSTCFFTSLSSCLTRDLFFFSISFLSLGSAAAALVAPLSELIISGAGLQQRRLCCYEIRACTKRQVQHISNNSHAKRYQDEGYELEKSIQVFLIYLVPVQGQCCCERFNPKFRLVWRLTRTTAASYKTPYH